MQTTILVWHLSRWRNSIVNERTCRAGVEEAVGCGQRLAIDVAVLRRAEFDSAVTIERISVHSPQVRSLLPASCRSHGIGDLLFSNRRGSPLNERLVDTIVNTGGNSCKKFESLRLLGAESFLLPLPSFFLFTSSIRAFRTSARN